MTTHVDAILIDRKDFRSGPISVEENREEGLQGDSTPRVPARRFAERAKQALRWAGICFMIEAAVVTVLAAVGLLTGMTAGHHLFWALGVGFCLATPPCVVATVVTAEVIEDSFHETEQRNREPT